MNGGNRLASAASPYLRQHADNPVDWYPWGDAAFERARQEEKPILLSIGYASCHWCHVMARESFQDPAVAALMNELFVNVKVDREERPDVDAVYMAAVQALTGHGGWPLTVALTPAGEPFYGGTYFPPEDRHGAPAFTRVLRAIADAWTARRGEVEASASELTQALKRMEEALGPAPDVGGAAALVEQVVERLEGGEDRTHGGFGEAPKFPPHETLGLLLAQPGERHLALALRTLRAMAEGGIRDQLGGGFARYAVDAGWRVPHFEMMLYDNAAMLRNYATAYSRSGDVALRDVAYELAAWPLHRLAFDPEGDGGPLAAAAPARDAQGRPLPREVGFFSALDADQQGEEGAYYLWTEEEFRRAAGEDADLAARRFGVTTPGPVGGSNVLYQATPVADLAQAFGASEEEVRQRLARVKGRLLEARSRRHPPAIDDKALASWNGLMLGAYASAGRLLAEPELLDVARANARFLRARLWNEGQLWHMWRQGQRSVEGLLEDYAYVGLGLLELYRATFEDEHLRWALELADAVAERFHDDDGAGYFSTAADMRRLVVRPKGYIDAATPSENAAAAELVWRTARYTGDDARRLQAEAALTGIQPAVLQAPQAFASSLRALLLMEAPPREMVFAGAPGSPALEELLARWRRFDDGSALVLLLDGQAQWQAALPLAEGRLPDPGAAHEAKAYICTGGVCQLPATAPGRYEEQLVEAGYAVVTSSGGAPRGAGAD